MMADLRVENPATTQAYVDALAHVDVKLPLTPSADDCGVIVDADGRGIITIDVNNERPDDQVAQIADWIALAVNTCGGFNARRT
jgi:hypothetical protein